MAKMESKKVTILFRIIAIVMLIVMTVSILQRNDVGIFASFTWISTVQPIIYGIAGVTVFIILIVRLKHNLKIRDEIFKRVKEKKERNKGS